MKWEEKSKNEGTIVKGQLDIDRSRGQCLSYSRDTDWDNGAIDCLRDTFKKETNARSVLSG